MEIISESFDTILSLADFTAFNVKARRRKQSFSVQLIHLERTLANGKTLNTWTYDVASSLTQSLSDSHDYRVMSFFSHSSSFMDGSVGLSNGGLVHSLGPKLNILATFVRTFIIPRGCILNTVS